MIRPIKRKRGESGNALFLGTAALVYIIPLMGLSIDTSFLYAVKGRVQAAVDGASLGAARALNLGTTLQAQQTAAAQNAVNWFYANFPPNTWATTGTIMSNGSVTQNNASGFYSQNVNIYPDATNAQLDHVDITASTNVPTWFMHWFGVNSTKLNVKSSATRRAAVVMMVLDRSGSMCAPTALSSCTKTNTTTACAEMISAAKQFTGQFAAGRDYIGMLTFSTNTYIVKNSGGTNGVPDQQFQTTLGYTSSFGTGTGAIDNITCQGGTGTAQAVAQGFGLLQQAGLPGALNILLVETDGLPNSLTLNFYDSVNNKVALAAGSNCTDASTPTPKKVGGGGFNTSSVIPQWNQIGLNLRAAPFGTAALTYPNPTTPTGMVGVVYTSDPPSAGSFTLMFNQWNNPSGPQATEVTAGSGSNGAYNTNKPITAAGCQFNGSTTSSTSDFAWWPTTDVYGSQLAPSSYPYKTVTTSQYASISRVDCCNYTNFHNAASNAVDNAGYQIRSNTTYQPYVFTLGLGGNGTTDHILLQRLANDPDGDQFNTPANYSACDQEPTCHNYTDQLQGQYVYAPTSAQLGQAFQAIASQILRLNK